MWWTCPPPELSAGGAGSTEGSCNVGVSPTDGPPLGPSGRWAGLVSGSPKVTGSPVARSIGALVGSVP